MVVVVLDLVVEKIELNASLAEKFLTLIATMVLTFADDATNTTINNHHSTGAAGSHTAIERSAVESDATTGSLTDGILFGMDGADAMIADVTIGIDALTEEVSDLIAMRETSRRTDIAGDEELLILDDDAATTAAVAGSPFRSRVGEFHKILVP